MFLNVFLIPAKSARNGQIYFRSYTNQCPLKLLWLQIQNGTFSVKISLFSLGTSLFFFVTQPYGPMGTVLQMYPAIKCIKCPKSLSYLTVVQRPRIYVNSVGPRDLAHKLEAVEEKGPKIVLVVRLSTNCMGRLGVDWAICV